MRLNVTKSPVGQRGFNNQVGGVKTILRDLYDWTEQLDADNWERLDAVIRERADDRAWHREIIRRADAVAIARAILFETPQELCGMKA